MSDYYKPKKSDPFYASCIDRYSVKVEEVKFDGLKQMKALL